MGTLPPAIRRHWAPVYLTLPFVDDDLCRKTEGIVRGSQLNLRIAWKGGPSLKSKLVRSAYLPVPCPGAGRHCNCCEAGLRGKCHTKNAVYRMDCTLCTKDESFYVGETRRSVRLRYNEHIRDEKKQILPSVSTKPNTLMYVSTAPMFLFKFYMSLKTVQTGRSGNQFTFAI